MAVVTINSGINHNLTGMACKWDVGIKKEIPLFPEDVDKGFRDCCYQNYVFADNSGEDTHNDKNSFLFKLNKDIDILTFKLYKNGLLVGNLSSQFATLYPLGTFTNYPDQLLLTGFTIDWNKVLYHARGGVGVYTIEAILTEYNGVVTKSMSLPYILWQYSDDKADKTIRIETTMNGLMKRTDINYTSINLIDMIRVRGFCGRMQPEITTTNDIFSTLSGEKRVVKQRKVQKVDIFELEIQPVPKCILDKIINYHFFADVLKITDYNINNYDYNIIQKNVYLHEDYEISYSDTTRYAYLKAKLKEAIQDNEKLNNL